MKKLLQILATALGISLVAIGLSTSAMRTAVKAAPLEPVLVANPPLNVQGTVAASQSGPWSVAISGTPSVTIAGDVHLANNGTPMIVRDADNPGRQSFSQTGTCQFRSVGANANVCDAPDLSLSTVVPQGKVLVLEDFSGQCLMPADGALLQAGISLFTVSGNTAGIFSGTAFAPITSVSAPSIFLGTPGAQATFGRTLRLYAPPGSTLGPTLVSNPITGLNNAFKGNCLVSWSGYYVNQ